MKIQKSKHNKDINQQSGPATIFRKSWKKYWKRGPGKKNQKRSPKKNLGFAFFFVVVVTYGARNHIPEIAEKSIENWGLGKNKSKAEPILNLSQEKYWKPGPGKKN